MELLTFSQYQEKSYAEIPTGRGWVNYGEDNLFPQYLVDLYRSSATHNALCTSIATMIFGEGVQTDNEEANLKISEWGLNDEIRKASLDLKIQGGFALEVIYSLDRSSIAKVKHLPFENVRSGEVNEDDKVDFYYYSRDWSDSREEPQESHKFDPEEAVEYPLQILYVKTFSVGSLVYPKPDYIGSIDYVELDKEIAKYHINNIKSGLAPSYIINFSNGTPAPEERRKIRNDIERQLAGTTNAGKFIMTFSDDPSRKPDFEPFPLSDADKQYQFLSDEVSSKIMIGHRATSPQLFGVAVSGKLGGGGELKVSEDIFKNDVIEPYRRVMVDAIESLLNASGVSAEVTLEVTALEEASVDQSFTGIQISSAVDIIAKVGFGELTTPQAIQLLVSMLGFTRENAEEMFEGVVVRPREEEEMDHSEFHTLAEEYFAGCGEEIDEEEWEVVDEREVDYDQEDTHDALWNFANIPDHPEKDSKFDTSVIKVRYRYYPEMVDFGSGGKSGDNKSRDFCRNMVSMGRVYRKEDIQRAKHLIVNKGFGEGGADTYSVWLYKGGPRCHHFWSRVTYLKKNNKKINAREVQDILNSLPPSERAEARPKRNAKKVAQHPNDMPRKGFSPRNRNLPEDAK